MDWFANCMIKNAEVLKNLEDDFIKGPGKLSYEQSLKLFTDMWQEGQSLGILPQQNPLEGIEVDIRIAKVLNSCLKKFSLK